MPQDWRVSLTVLDPRASQQAYLTCVVRDLRSRLDAHIDVGSGETGVFLYAETAEAAGAAAQKAQEILQPGGRGGRGLFR